MLPWRRDSMAFWGRCHQVRAARVIMGWSQGEHFIQREAKAVGVAVRAWVSSKLLGSHIPKCADDVARARNIVIFHRLCQTKVGNPNASFGVQQQVRRFYVTMKGALFVGVFQCVGDLLDDPRHAAKVIGLRTVLRWRQERSIVQCGDDSIHQ